MDNHLTPSKIQRLIHLAEDKSFTRSHRFLLNDDDKKSIPSNELHAHQPKTSSVNLESSSGILDLEKMEAFGESALGNESLSKSTAFTAREMSGRSTGVDEFGKTMPLGRHSLALESITSQMNKQTNEIQDIIRHSICNTTTYSFHSKRDLTADEASLVMREAPLPVLPSVMQPVFPDSVNNSNASSVGAYFQNRCPEFMKMLEKTDSPDRYTSMPSISEVSIPHPHTAKKYNIDESLDCVPVRQSRVEKLPEKLNINNPIATNTYEKLSILSTTSKLDVNNETYNKDFEHKYSSASNAPEPRLYHIPQTLIPVATSSFTSSKPFQASSSKVPTEVLIRNMQQSLRTVTDNTEGSACPSENSLSISKIADYLGKESNISVTGILKYKNRKTTPPKKQPLTELNMNLQESSNYEGMPVTTLRDSRKADTASSAGTINTVISLDKLNISQNRNPEIIIMSDSNTETLEEYSKKRSTRSKSPSSRSRSTLSTVQENCTSFKSGDSPLHSSKGEGNNTHILSPNIEYRELDKSVDWQEVLQQKRHKEKSLAKEQWADVTTSPTNGFVGVRCPVDITITTLSDSWLTARIQFDNLPNEGKDITIELPRLPFLLSPGKCETFTFHITTFVEMNTKLSYTITLKDAAIDDDVEQKGTLDVNIKMPMIQTMSCDGVNKVTFPPIPEKSALTKSFVLISDCPVDLQLDLTIVEGGNMFVIKSVQEIKKSDVNKVLMENQGTFEEGQQGKGKGKGLNKQLCRLSSGNAIKVAVKFNAPQLSEFQIEEHIVTFTGGLNVNLIGVGSVLRKVELVGIVGTVKLVIKVPDNKLQLTKEPVTVPLYNMGSIKGVWVVKSVCASTDNFPFKVSPLKFELLPGAIKHITLCYTDPEDTDSEATLTFEELFSGNTTTLQISGSTDKPKSFPIKTNFNKLSFVRPGRKELSLKNSTDKKIHIICHLTGDGFSIDLPGMEKKGVSYCLAFAPMECRSLHIMFNPVSNIPCTANLHLVHDKNGDFSRTVRLYGWSSGELLRWAGLVTYGDTALVRAASREPIALQLYNKSSSPAFVCARVHFNLQDTSVSSTARLEGGTRVVGGRSRHTLTLHVDWARIERRARDAAAAALATVTVLTGAESTRRRILRVLRDESSGALDLSPLDEHQKVLANQFDGEDPNMDNMLADFNEHKSALSELVSGLHELTAQIVLPQDFADENTIIIADDTVVEHHTLCD